MFYFTARRSSFTLLTFLPVLSTAYKICSWLVVALGCAHLLFTLHDYDEFSLRALWFFGSGLAIVFAGFLNVALVRDGGRDRVIRALCLITDAACALLFAAAIPLLRQPQVFLGVALFAFAAVAAFLTRAR
jgi:hypothetical protein